MTRAAEAVQPETSSSYLASITIVSKDGAHNTANPNQHTLKNSPVGSQKAVLERLFEVTVRKSRLLGQDLMNVLAAEESYFITSVTIVDAKEAYTLILGLRRRVLGVLEVEDGSVRVLHGDPPALHARKAVDEPIISAIFSEL